MVSGLGTAWNTAKRYGNYGANFLFGTGSEVVGAEVRNAVQARKATGAGLTSSIFDGFKKGMAQSNQQVVNTGFLTNLRNTFKSLPSEMTSGWKNANVAGKGAFGKFFTKTGQFLKPLGKTMPFAMNALWLLSSIPNIMERTQDTGVWGGIKETAKTLGKMAMCSIGGIVGAAFGGFGGIIGCSAGLMLSDFLFGKDYSVQKAQEQEKLAKAQEAMMNTQQAQAGAIYDYKA